MDDLEFVQRCVKGDKLAWDEFVDKYSSLIYHYIHSVFKLKGISLSYQDTVRDLFQDFFIALTKDNFKRLKSFKAKNNCSLASWLRQIVVNYSIDYVRRLKPVISLDEESGNGRALEELTIADFTSPVDALVLEDRLVHLTDCIQGLDVDDKYFLELYLNRGLSLMELERLLRISRSAVDMRKARIVQRLRDCFKIKGFVLDLE